MYKLLTCLWMMIGLLSAQDKPFDFIEEAIDPLEDKLIEQEEVEMEQRFEEEEERGLHHWVVEEMKSIDEGDEIITR